LLRKHFIKHKKTREKITEDNRAKDFFEAFLMRLHHLTPLSPRPTAGVLWAALIAMHGLIDNVMGKAD
jgi:hypothetical protein